MLCSAELIKVPVVEAVRLLNHKHGPSTMVNFSLRVRDEQLNFVAPFSFLFFFGLSAL